MPIFVLQGTRLLRLYSFYSLFLAIVLLVITVLDQDHSIMGSQRPLLMLVCAISYVILAAVFSAIAVATPDPEITTGYIFIEIVLLSCMMLASGGLGTGFPSLIAISVVISNLLAPGLFGYGAAAWTTITIIYTQVFLTNSLDSQDTVSIGLYGFLCFMLSWITQSLARRLNSALTLASTQAQHIQHLQQLSQQALQSLPNAIVACNQEHQVLFANEQAHKWFALQEGQGLPDDLVFDGVHQSLKQQTRTFLIHKMPLVDADKAVYLLDIQDSARISAEAQQLKLASLGRLTASIAHEIRNPLSALKQSAQLLKEAPYLQTVEQQLCQIIEQQSERINKIIEDILQLSRRKQATPEVFQLKPWLQQFSDEFRQLYFYEEFQINVHCPVTVSVMFDSNHLQQVLSNLCGNALRYIIQNSRSNARLNLVVKPHDEGRVQLDVLDNGGGISAEQQRHLFEPFYTSEHNGTGLGLYLCRELCEANQARIHYEEIPNGSCFRIIINAR